MSGQISKKELDRTLNKLIDKLGSESDTTSLSSLKSLVDSKASSSHTHSALDLNPNSCMPDSIIYNRIANRPINDIDRSGASFTFGNGKDSVSSGSTVINIGHKNASGKNILYISNIENNRIFFDKNTYKFNNTFNLLYVNGIVFASATQSGFRGKIWIPIRIEEIDNQNYSILINNEKYSDCTLIKSPILIPEIQGVYELNVTLGHSNIHLSCNNNQSSFINGTYNLGYYNNNSLINGLKNRVCNSDGSFVCGNYNSISSDISMIVGSNNIVDYHENLIGYKVDGNKIYIDDFSIVNISKYRVGDIIYCKYPENTYGKITTHTIESIQTNIITVSNDTPILDTSNSVVVTRFIDNKTSCYILGSYNNILSTGGVAIGHHININTENQTVIGKYNISNVEGGLVIGKGSTRARANCFRVTDTAVYATGNYNTTGADYAEYFEWEDGNKDNEDRVGLFVSLNGDKISLANGNDNDFILGIISGNPSVIGDSHEDQWNGMYLYDIYGRPIMEEVEIEEKKELREVIKDGNDIEQEKEYEEVIVEPARTEIRQKLNPNYNSNEPYIPRSNRKEWDVVGMMGKLVLIDDGTCIVNEYVKSTDGGIGTYSDSVTRYRMMSRIDESHIRVLVM